MNEKTRKLNIMIMIVTIISMLMSITAMAANDGKHEKALNNLNDSQILPYSNGYPSEVTIDRLELYPANVDTQEIYKDNYTVNGPTANQWLTTYINSKTTQDYRKNNCNGFYVVLYTSNYRVASRYEALDGYDIVKTGRPTWEIDFFVRTKYKTVDGKYDYARWEVDFYGSTNQGFPLYGPIYIKAN